jgi:hypothetical protein
LNRPYLRCLPGTVLVVAAFSNMAVAAPSSAADALVYGIATVSIDSTKADQYPKYLQAERVIQAKHGVKFVASYQVQFGEDLSRQINIWSAPDAEILRRGLGAKDAFAPQLREIVQTEVVEVAERNPVSPLTVRSSTSASGQPSTVYAIAWVTIDSTKHDKFVDALRGEPPMQAKHGVTFVASYHIQLGNTSRELDIWSAPDAEIIRRSFFAPDAAAPGLYEVVKKEGVEIAELNPIGVPDK